MPDKIPRIYPITDPAISGLSHADQVRRFSEGGATLVQLRDKHGTGRELFNAARAALEAACAFGVRLLINDRVDIALAVGAHGVHLGQDDMSPDEARRLMGDKAIIGYSTHSLAQAVAGARLSVNYIAVGPVFPTRTKRDPDAVIGIEGLRQIREAVPGITLVAIGGIEPGNIESVFEAGADSVALISHLLSAPDAISSRLRLLL